MTHKGYPSPPALALSLRWRAVRVDTSPCRSLPSCCRSCSCPAPGRPVGGLVDFVFVGGWHCICFG